MKKILNLTGVKTLSKQQQQNIKGARVPVTCCGRNKCRISFGNETYCEPGHCLSSGYCILY
ncbi:hypothetical protein [Aquimarina longa]|uniref:hypothetical protein n=1 Tax=Aquimarina longa TaxID=1080221 RepID=UPI0007847DE3|nr:hypothetical protein [Aquimarina longa]